MSATSRDGPEGTEPGEEPGTPGESDLAPPAGPPVDTEEPDRPAGERGFFGHPRGLATLFATEAWERFSYYGMKAILLYYMYDRATEGGLGIAPATASSLIAVYGASIYLAAIAGGWLSDRILGARRATLYGGVLIMLGHICLALPAGRGALYASMALIVLGTGLLKPNVSTSVGSLYAKNDPRRDAGFSIYYMGISVGAVLAPLLVGTLGQRYDYHLGFGLAAVGMAAGLVVYIRGGHRLSPADLRPSNPLHRSDVRAASVLAAVAGLTALTALLVAAARTGTLTADAVVGGISVLAVALPVGYFTVMLRSSHTTPRERAGVRAYIPLFVAAVFFWFIQEQGASVLALYADRSTDLGALGFTVPSSWFQSTGSLVLICLTPLFAVLWVRLGSRQPPAPTKFGLGLVLAGLSYVLLVYPALQSGRSNPLWLFASFTVVTVGEILLSPVGLSVTTQLAPAAFVTQTMGLWLASNAAAQGISAQVVRLYDRDHAATYFGVIGGTSVVVGLALLAALPAVQRRIRTATGGTPAQVRVGVRRQA
ncbi:peptide MFS transporter [Streptomyces sp. NPDC017993]|uniref:peptide MFS transporter n=1 Tax=Streptomyces sp. NPDC017993 TaxID=3365027 RepID=UPI0037B3ACE7